MSNEQVVERLREAKSYVERGWTQGAVARDANGYAVEQNEPEACSWCALGALGVAYPETGSVVFDQAYLLLAAASGVGAVAVFNDAPGRTKEEVLALFDRAIARAEAANV